jgi:hypothetical protein
MAHDDRLPVAASRDGVGDATEDPGPFDVGGQFRQVGGKSAEGKGGRRLGRCHAEREPAT